MLTTIYHQFQQRYGRIARQTLTYLGGVGFIGGALTLPLLFTNGQFKAMVGVNALVFGPILAALLLYLMYYDVGDV